MKYIRTKDENNLIIDLTNMLLPYNLTDEYVDFNKFGMFKIVKQANTIKELCDCFIFIDEGCEPEILYEDDLPVFPTEESELYGAIWIKGEHNEPILKPVAKANDKGELELI